jgi:hypothetical protein
MGLVSRGLTPSPHPIQDYAEPQQREQQEFVEKQVFYHSVSPSVGKTMIDHPFLRLRNYPHAGGTRPPVVIEKFLALRNYALFYKQL